MCKQHHSLIRALIDEIRSLREALEYAEERVERCRRNAASSVAEYRSELQAERDRSAWEDFERGLTLKELKRAYRSGDTVKAERLVRKLEGWW